MKKSIWLLLLLFLILIISTACDAQDTQNGTAGLEYYSLPDGTYGVMAGSTQYLSHIEIPSTHEGKAVTQVLSEAFSGAINLTSITIPDSVTSIGDRAFRDCTSLASIAVPNSVTSIGQSAFSGCASLTSVALSNNIATIGDTTFRNCTGLTEIIIPDSVTTIGNRVFDGCASLNEIIIPDSVTTIGCNLFMNCPALTTVSAPTIFWHVDNLPNSTIANQEYLSLTTAIITAGDNIFDYAFYSYSAMTAITISDSVTSIGVCAFGDCTSLTTITYTGTIEQWNLITKNDDWNFNVPAAEVVCSDGVVALS